VSSPAAGRAASARRKARHRGVIDPRVSTTAGTARWRHWFGEVFLAGFLAIAPSTIPAWRADLRLRPVAELAVGEPVLYLETRRPQYNRPAR
jgi:hypothetical protein